MNRFFFIPTLVVLAWICALLCLGCDPNEDGTHIHCKGDTVAIRGICSTPCDRDEDCADAHLLEMWYNPDWCDPIYRACGSMICSTEDGICVDGKHTCIQDSHCAEGFICVANLCYWPCDRDEDCPKGRADMAMCDLMSGLCTSLPAGIECLSNHQCQDGEVCLNSECVRMDSDATNEQEL